jgi:hypothetical protein
MHQNVGYCKISSGSVFYYCYGGVAIWMVLYEVDHVVTSNGVVVSLARGGHTGDYNTELKLYITI